MIKDAIISALAAGLAVDKFSQITVLTVSEQVGIWIAFAVILFIFLLFLDIQAEKRQKRRERVQQLRKYLEKLAAEKEVTHGNSSGQVCRAPADNDRFSSDPRMERGVRRTVETD